MDRKDSPLRRLGDAIDNGELDGPTARYKCDKCSRETEWIFYVGIPVESLPCGSKCGGLLKLQKIEKV